MLSADCCSLHPRQARLSLAPPQNPGDPGNPTPALAVRQREGAPLGWDNHGNRRPAASGRLRKRGPANHLMASTDHGRRDALPVGTVLREFTIQAVIGHGGFGIVYRAGHNELDLTVAIKEYLPVELAVREGATVQPRSGTERKDFEEGLRRFRDEAQALIDFDSHPSIVSCREFFRAHGTAYLVMGYEDGESLAEVLASREAEGRPFAAADLLGVMRPVLEGLARVHAAGVLHRDIKPSNILIRRRDGRPVLIDFGAAKQATARFSKSQAPYTEGYAALEQVADTGRLGPWTDMYGVGAVMWRMVAGGKRPWEPPHPVRVEQRSHAAVGGTEDPLPSASELGKGRFPKELLEVIDRCLRLRETERTQGSREVLEALREVSELPPGGVAEAPRPAAERSGPKRQERGSREVPAGVVSRKGWRRGVWIALASLAVGLGLVFATWRNVQPWIRDWDALGDIRDPGFAETAQAYIDQYTQVPEASVWVAKAEGLLAELRDLEAERPPHREAGETWMNSLGMEFVWIPAGKFLMGSPEDEEGRDDDERQHEVRISEGYWMKKHEVTQGEWEVVMGENPFFFTSCGPRCPVGAVSWDDTQEFIRRLHSRESVSGYLYRLPTEAEWEYAARAGTTRARHGALDAIAWHRGNSGGGTHPVGQKRPNAWGLHDMLGNVWEWTGDWYGAYVSGPMTDPGGPESGSARVIRGGSWRFHARGVRSAARYAASPGSRFYTFGFRLARTE